MRVRLRNPDRDRRAVAQVRGSGLAPATDDQVAAEVSEEVLPAEIYSA